MTNATTMTAGEMVSAIKAKEIYGYACITSLQATGAAVRYKRRVWSLMTASDGSLWMARPFAGYFHAYKV